MSRISLKVALAAGLYAVVQPALAQSQVTYATYLCNNDVRFAAAYWPGYASIQIDGKSIELPHRMFSVSGTRYSKGGYVLTVKGYVARIKHNGITNTCTQE
jgi:membrane-bound inhibitor of C-type lysozyme